MSKEIDTLTSKSWPRNLVETVKCRKRDIVIRITDWTRDKDEPAFDVECYVAGVYDWNESQTFCTRSAKQTRKQAKTAAIAFAQKQIAKFVK